MKTDMVLPFPCTSGSLVGHVYLDLCVIKINDVFRWDWCLDYLIFRDERCGHLIKQ